MNSSNNNISNTLKVLKKKEWIDQKVKYNEISNGWICLIKFH